MTTSVSIPSIRQETAAAPQHTLAKLFLRYWLVGLLVALGSSLAQSAWAQTGRHDMHGSAWGANPQHMQRMLSRIGASEEQKARIQQILQKAASDMAGQREAGKTLREKARAILAAPTVDANAAEQVRQQMLAHHDQNSRRMMTTMLEVSQVLTPEQRAQIAQHVQKHGEHHGRRGRAGGPGQPQQP